MQQTSEDTQRSLGRLEGKLDQLIEISRQVRSDLVEHNKDDSLRFAEMRGEIVVLKQQLSAGRGAISVIVRASHWLVLVVASILGGVFGAVAHKYFP